VQAELAQRPYTPNTERDQQTDYKKCRPLNPEGEGTGAIQN
jgi:hypothetical protein